MIIKKIKEEEIKKIDKKKEIIIKEGNSIENYKIFDNYKYINRYNEEIFVNERCLVNEKGYFYKVSKLKLYDELELFVKHEEALSKTKIMKYFNYALINNTKYIVMIVDNNGLSNISIIVNKDEETVQNHLKYWISEENNIVILDIFLMDCLDSLSIIPSLIKM